MLKERKYQIMAVAIIVMVLLVAVWGTLALNSLEKKASTRYQQHQSTQRVSDLSTEDQEAVSSTSTEVDTFATHLPLVSIETGGKKIPGERVVEGAADVTSESAVSGDQAGATAVASTSTNEAAATSSSATASTAAGATATTTDGKYTLSENGERTISTTFRLYSRDGANRLSDAPVVETRAETSYRGHSSRYFDKKSYALQFTEEDRVTENQVNVLGMGKDDEWILYGPFLDKTLIRNYLMLNIAGQVMGTASEVRFCELFVDGEYQGVYVLMQPASKAVSRDNVYSLGANRDETGYVIKRDWIDENEVNAFGDFLNESLHAASTTNVSVEYPSPQNLTEGQFNYIQRDLNAIEKALYSYDYDSKIYGYTATLDVDSFANYFILNEFCYNTDAGIYSTFYYKSAGGKLCAGPVWDFNNAFDNSLEAPADVNGFIMTSKPMYYMLCKDEIFTEFVIERYRALRQGVLSDAYLESYIDDVIDYLGPAVDRNFKVWGYSFDPANVDANNKLSPDDRNPKSFQEAVGQLKSYIYKRGAWLDEYIVNLRQFSHESAVKKYN